MYYKKYEQRELPSVCMIIKCVFYMCAINEHLKILLLITGKGIYVHFSVDLKL